MADSKYLKYQDKNQDGLIDVCDDVETIPTKNCPSCKRNPNAITPKWKTKTVEDPWFNEKYCSFQCTVVTSEQSLIPTEGATEEESKEFLNSLFADNAPAAVESLLDKFNKIETAEVIQKLTESIDYTKYDLSARPFSTVKLLYTIPYDLFAPIEERPGTDEEEEATDTGDVVVEYQAEQINDKLLTMRKAMHMFSRYYRVYNAIENGVFKFVDSGKVFTKNQFDRYGDPGFFVGNSRMKDILSDLDSWMNDRGMNIFGTGSPSFSRDRAKRIEFTVSSEFKLKKIKVWTVGCGDKPRVFGERRLNSLKSKESWKDSTAVAYFMRLDDIVNFLSARVERPWTEFIEEYTYPQVTAVFDYPMDEEPSNIPGATASAISCVADALAEEGKQLGQDVVDSIFSVGDAVAYQFHRNICYKDREQLIDDKTNLGLIYKNNPTGRNPDRQSLDFGKIIDPRDNKKTTTIGALAADQAFREMEDTDQIFVQMCASMLQGAVPVTSSDEFFRDFYKFGLQKIKVCGLLDMMLDSIQCLFKGMSLEDALSSSLRAALRAMSIENFGKLFVGLPPRKQSELDALVKRKLENNDLIVSGTGAQKLSDAVSSGSESYDNDNIPLIGEVVIVYPWEDREVLESDDSFDRNNRTLAQQYDVGINSGNRLNPDKIMEAYTLAMIEVYADDPLQLVDLMNKFPGAEIIANIIAIVDCPSAPLFDPSVVDFIKSIEMPFCRNINEITLPRMENPFAWKPEVTDWPRQLFAALVAAIYAALIQVIKALLTKVCEVIGDAICKAIESRGDMASSLPAIVTGRSTFSDVIRESICGPDANEAQVDATIAEMFEKLGVGGAALSDSESVKSFTNDISNAVTRREMLEAFSGTASNDFLDVTHTILVNQYPQFAEGLVSKQSLSDFFENCGNLFPVSVRGAIRDLLNALPAVDDMPANPSLCANPEDLDNFKDRRCTLLSGRATPEQCDQMFKEMQDEMIEDLDQLNNVLQGGIPAMLEDALPPLVSTPGCDDGLIPFESEDSVSTASQTLAQSMEQLKIDFSTDMIGNGPGKSNWGLMNLILSDTSGAPLTAHMRNEFLRPDYVDLVSNVDAPDNLIEAIFMNPRPTEAQKGQFPGYVAEWLQSQMSDLTPEFSSNNEWSPKKIYKKSFRELGVDPYWGGLNLLSLPDFGYNVKVLPNMEEQEVRIIRKGRKKKADISLFFEDNSQGRKSLGETEEYEYGFKVNFFLSDLETRKDSSDNSVVVNQPTDNVRISIVDYYRFAPLLDQNYKGMSKDQRAKAKEEFKKRLKEGVSLVKDRRFEFSSVDDTLSDIQIENYPEFFQTQKAAQEYLPQIVMLSEMISLSPAEIKPSYDSIMSNIFSSLIEEVAGTTDDFGGPAKAAWQFGAQLDDLNSDDLDYVVRSGDTLSPAGTEYGEAEVTDYDSDGNPDGTRDIENDDMLMGISRMQYEETQGSGRKNRVFYLDPMTYGGNYINPPIYIKPLENKAWLGFVDVMFPEISPCKPSRTDIVDFEDLSEEVSKSYESMPEDQRLKSDPDCIVEKPYNRVLERYSKAGIQGLIKAACRVYSSTHFVKSLATFTTFAPKFTETYSSIYAAYVVENMEASMKDSQGAAWEISTFKDEEFWYAFLEQSVQTYARLVDDGTIIDPPDSVLQALFRLNDAQDEYRFPYRENLKAAKETGAAGTFRTLKSWRYEKNLDAVRATEEDAKLVLKEMVITELNYMGERFVENLGEVGMAPKFTDMDYYLMSELSTGGGSLDLDKEIVETATSLPDSGEELYTNGAELSTSDGIPYIGYYHVHTDQDGNVIYMEGEYHSDTLHNELNVYADKITVPIGDVAALGSVSTSTKPFMIEKYISVNGVRYAPDEAVEIIKANDPDLNISDVYPGDIELVYADEVKKNLYGEAAPIKTINRYEYTDPDSAPVIGSGYPEGSSDTRVVGIKGNLGVRYGLKFSVIVDGIPREVTSAEVDALDLKTSQMPSLEGNTKLLYCLLKNLKDDEKFGLIARYIFPLPKVTATVAIYNDMGFLPSIGQLTTDEGANQSGVDDISDKPGARVIIDDDTGEVVSYEATPGWQHIDDRPRFTPFTRMWDEWDQVLLRNSKSRIKKSFKTLYNLRDFKPGNDDSATGAARTVVNNLKSAMKERPAVGLLPWWKRSKLRSNPFDSKGKLCEKK